MKDDRSLTSVIIANENAITTINTTYCKTVNGIGVDENNNINVSGTGVSYATEIPMSDTDPTTVFEAIDSVATLTGDNSIAIHNLINEKADKIDTDATQTELTANINSVVQINNPIPTAIPFPTTSTQAPFINIPINTSNYTIVGDTVTLNSDGVYRFDFYICVNNLNNNTAGIVYIYMLKDQTNYLIHNEPISANTEKRMISVTRSTLLNNGATFTITGYTTCSGLGIINLNGNTNGYELTITKIADSNSLSLIRGKENGK